MTYARTESVAEDSVTWLASLAYLEKALQPPDLEDALADKNSHLEYTPPLNTLVCRLGGVAVDALAQHDVRLLVLDLGEKIGQRTNCTILSNLLYLTTPYHAYLLAPEDPLVPRTLARKQFRGR